MNKKTVISVVLILAFCAALSRPAAALDRVQDPEQLENIGRELSQDSYHHPVNVRVKDTRKTHFRAPGRTFTKHPQSELLQELLHATDSGILEELLVSTSINDDIIL